MGCVGQRVYQRNDIVWFRTTKGQFGGLSNMAPRFVVHVNGVRIRTVEALYQACRFPTLPDVQRMILGEGSPMTAKMKSKRYRAETRPDWDAVRVSVMRWCLRVKLAENWDAFGRLLLSTGHRPIVEDSSKDDFWGARPTVEGTLVGRNVLGRLLMELREHLGSSARESLRCVNPPPIPNFVLLGEPVGQLPQGGREVLRGADPLFSRRMLQRNT